MVHVFQLLKRCILKMINRNSFRKRGEVKKLPKTSGDKMDNTAARPGPFLESEAPAGPDELAKHIAVR